MTRRYQVAWRGLRTARDGCCGAARALKIITMAGGQDNDGRNGNEAQRVDNSIIA